MKAIKLTFLAVSCFTCSAIFAQDTTNKPKPDTTNKPKPDTSKKLGTTGMRTISGNLNSDVYAANFFFKSEDKISAKKEETKG